ncbi:MAG: STAS/SEC14 domain-containing protein [Opitutaceae bacterium]|jgi:hypothetical protein|nr:STAS/SEC14 domain-containing protein [Opitutaceae bacterium]
MPIDISTPAPKILLLRISGELTQPELAAGQLRAVECIKKDGAVRFMILLEGFTGFANNFDWNDVSFQFENDAFIEKMAFVGPKKWESTASIFTGKGIRPFPINFFPPEDALKAKAWLLG